jgi:hypothetical protein
MKNLWDGCFISLIALFMGLVVGLAFCLIWAFFAELLWNYVMPLIFGLPTITFWQMLALMVLVRMVMPFSITYNKNND